MSEAFYPEFTPEMMQEFEQMSSTKLRIPENARKRTFTAKKGKPDQHEVLQRNWRESATVQSVVATPATDEHWGQHMLFQIKFQITATKGSGLNVNRNKTLSIKQVRPGTFGPDDWRTGNAKRGGLLLTQLIRAKGYEIAGAISSAQMAAFYPMSGESPLVNAEVEIEIASKDDSDFDDVVNIYRLQTATADVEV